MRSRRAPTNGVVSTLAGATKRAAGHQQDVSDLREIHENNISWSDSKKWPPLLHHCAVSHLQRVPPDMPPIHLPLRAPVPLTSRALRL